MKSNQRGFGVVEGLLVLIIVILIGFIGYYVYSQNKKTNTTLNNGTQSSSSGDLKTTTDQSAKLTETYTGNAGKSEFTFKYPKTWTLEKGKISDDGVDGDKIFSPDKDVYLSITHKKFGINMGGVGSNCDETTNDSKIVDVQKIALPSFSDATLISFSESNGAFNEFVGNTSSSYKSDINGILAGKNSCVAVFTSWFNWTDYGYGNVVIIPNKYLDKDKAIKMTADQLSTYKNSSSHKTALEIVKTLKITN